MLSVTSVQFTTNCMVAVSHRLFAYCFLCDGVRTVFQNLYTVSIFGASRRYAGIWFIGRIYVEQWLRNKGFMVAAYNNCLLILWTEQCPFLGAWYSSFRDFVSLLCLNYTQSRQMMRRAVCHCWAVLISCSPAAQCSHWMKLTTFRYYICMRVLV